MRWGLLALVGGAVAVARNASLEFGGDHFVLAQVRRALGSPSAPRDLASALIDDRFEYLREQADYRFAAEDGAGVAAVFGGAFAPRVRVPVVDLQASAFNASALCDFLRVGVDALRRAEGVEAFVLLSLGSAAFGSPFYPAVARRAAATCGADGAALRRLLLEPKLRRWFVSQHFPVVAAGGGGAPLERPRGRGGGDPLVGDTRDSSLWVLHPKLHHVPLGVPRVFSRRLQRETAWLRALDHLPPARAGAVYVNHKPRDYREAVGRTVAAGLGLAALPNAYVGKDRVKQRDAGDTRAYVDAMVGHRFVLSPPGSGVDCYRHWEAILCGALPIVEYSPLAAELLAGLPALLVRSWAEVDDALLDAAFDAARRTTYDLRRLTTAFWRAALAKARATPHALLAPAPAAPRPRPPKRPKYKGHH